MPPIASILLSVCLGVAGQLLLKTGVARLGALALTDSGVVRVAMRIASNAWIWAGLALYGVSVLLWLVALSAVELSYAYPFISLSYVLIVLASWLLFGEEISLLRVLGVLVICFGVYSVAGA